jgi:transposase
VGPQLRPLTAPRPEFPETFHRAYPCATQQAFLEAHELAFAYFEGVFWRLRYDNLSSAVKKILRGQQRELTARFIAFRSHWQYQAEFCTPGEGHEKGGVEGEVGYFRRNHWVPVPVASDLQALNRKLLEDCRAEESRVVSGQTECVGTRLLTRRSICFPWLRRSRATLVDTGVLLMWVNTHRGLRPPLIWLQVG